MAPEVPLTRRCTACETRYPADFVVCPRDASPLVDVRRGRRGQSIPLIGKLLGETYQIIRVVGEGGMGRVYEARHLRLKERRFAVKTLHSDLANEPRDRRALHARGGERELALAPERRRRVRRPPPPGRHARTSSASSSRARSSRRTSQRKRSAPAAHGRRRRSSGVQRARRGACARDRPSGHEAREHHAARVVERRASLPARCTRSP